MSADKNKVLLIGDGHSFFLEEIISRVTQVLPDTEFDLLPTNYNFEVSGRSFYSHTYLPGSFGKLCYKLVSRVSHNAAFYCMRFFLRAQLRKIKVKYDTVHIHFLNKNLLYIDHSLISKIADRLIVSLWGSDFYKRSPAEMQRMFPYLKFASTITIANEKTSNQFKDAFKEFSDKVCILKFGLSVLDSIDELNASDGSLALPHNVQIPEGCCVVTVGYSSHPDHQHMEVLQAIADHTSPEILQRVFFVFPFTYGDKRYAKKVVDFAKKLGLRYTSFHNRLCGSELAAIRLRTDVFIHVRKTDQLSGSFQEHLYAGSVVIAGSWLPYQELLDKGAFFYQVDSMKDVPVMIQKVLNSMDAEKMKTTVNRDIIRRMSSWQILTQQHVALYHLPDIK